MEIRPLRTPDLDGVIALYRQMLTEYADEPGRVRYPVVTDRTPDEMHAQLLQALWQPRRAYGTVADDAGQLVGVACGEVYGRDVGTPKTVGHCHFLYVAPGHRGGAGRRSVALRLMRVLADVALADHPDLVLEASAAVGSRTERVWQGLGFVPYQTLMAWVHPDMTPRAADDFFTRRRAYG